MAPEILKIRSLGAFYFFSEFKAAFILLLNVETVVFFCILCVSLLWPWQSKFMSHLFFQQVPPFRIWEVFMGVLAATFTSTEPASPVSPGSGVCRLCPCQIEAVIFPSLSAFLSCGWEVNWTALMFFPVVWSILAKQYFWQNMCHWVLNDFSKMRVVQASHLGENTYQATFRFER